MKKHKPYIFHLFVILMFLINTVSADGPSSKTSVDINSHPNVSINPQDEFASYIKKKNAGKLLPDLEYWGVEDAEWGNLKKNLIVNRVGYLSNLEFKRIASFNKDDELISIKWVFFGKIDAKKRVSELAASREKRFKLYEEIKKELVTAYRQPSHRFYPSYSVRNDKDAYSLGRSKGYHIEWHGGETNVSLRLSDKELVVEFSQPERSNAKDKKLAAARGEAVLSQSGNHAH